MAQYVSKYPELMFYVDGAAHAFKDGHFATEDKAVIEALGNLTDVERVDEPKAAPAKKPAKK